MNWKFWKRTPHKPINLGILWITVYFRNGKKLRVQVEGQYFGEMRGEPLAITAQDRAKCLVDQWNEDQAVEDDNVFYPMHRVKRIVIGPQGTMLKRFT